VNGIPSNGFPDVRSTTGFDKFTLRTEFIFILVLLSSLYNEVVILIIPTNNKIITIIERTTPTIVDKTF
jgi:3-polyprenyl-4-hydroxybenzoate decarboxylase